LLLNLYQEFETLIFQALTHAYPHSPQSQRQGIAFSIMCLANDAWSMVTLGFTADRMNYGRDSAQLLVETLK
ncbi:MAG: hypothetical protein GY796_32460, partial [Chloroflexi bacterium]|nr:hypothetical protein [Chloroflexota bacterium]